MFSNPYVLAAAAMFAIGFAVFEILSTRKERTQSYGSRRRRPPPPPPGDSPPRPGDSPPKGYRNSSTSSRGSGDSSVSSRQSKRPNSGCTDTSSVRRRTANLSENKQPTNDKNESVPYNPNQDAGQNAPSNVSIINTDTEIYEKKVYEKILNDISSANTESKIGEILSKNIADDDDSDSENNEEANAKLCNIDASNQVACSSKDSNDLLQLRKMEEEMYKEEVLDSLKSENVGNAETALASVSTGSDHVQQIDSHLNRNIHQGICSGCEDSPINAAAYPCGHCYLCSDCAQKIFRLHRKCSMCFAAIEKFEFSSM